MGGNEARSFPLVLPMGVMLVLVDVEMGAGLAGLAVGSDVEMMVWVFGGGASVQRQGEEERVEERTTYAGVRVW
eukprot:m.47532 g.47532  ORF g.47532 m.47532 type:complete len:74 (+) comp10985_c1_seq3:170-391(+)